MKTTTRTIIATGIATAVSVTAAPAAALAASEAPDSIADPATRYERIEAAGHEIARALDDHFEEMGKGWHGYVVIVPASWAQYPVTIRVSHCEPDPLIATINAYWTAIEECNGSSNDDEDPAYHPFLESSPHGISR